MQDILKSHFKKENSSLPGNRWFALLLGLVQNFYEKEHQCPEMPTHKKDLFFFFSFSNISIIDTKGMAGYTKFTFKVAGFTSNRYSNRALLEFSNRGEKK